MATSLAKERAELSRWRLLPAQAGNRKTYERILENEFREASEAQASELRQLRQILEYCQAQVPFYQKVFAEIGFSPEELCSSADLEKLPILDRHVVQREEKNLRATSLPSGLTRTNVTSSSGTTGQPVTIQHTQAYGVTFHLMKQREYRWFRFDPLAKLASVRNSSDLQRMPDGSRVPANITQKRTNWPSIGHYFETGPWVGLSDTTPIERQLQWLDVHQPHYLLGRTALVEQLAFANQAKQGWANLSAIEVISQQLTSEMRYKIERSFGVPVHQNYGLNEVGIVAARCPEAGRYHVHSESCIVEIVDEAGRATAPGQIGRVIVTVLNNPAMPLIRYDTDDLAEVAEGPCPCGRTLPSFVALHGRYQRSLLWPPGTLNYWDAILGVLCYADEKLTRGLRQYQLHQYKDETYELRLVCKERLSEAYIELILQAWREASEGDVAPLTISCVDVIERPAGGKIQNFTSDFAPVGNIAPE